MVLSLPYPPSMNEYWHHDRRGRVYIAQSGKTFRTTVGWVVKQARANERYADRLSVSVQLWMPDKRRRDIDNVLKPLLDALEHAGVYEDDSQIDQLYVTRCGVEKPGKCVVNVDVLRNGNIGKASRWALDNCS